MTRQATDADVAWGSLVVRASGAAAASAAIAGAAGDAKVSPAPETIQLLTRCTVPKAVAASGATRRFADCTLHVLPVGGDDTSARGTRGVVMLTVTTTKLSITFTELRPLMFQPVDLAAPLRAMFSSAIANVLAAGAALDPHGVAHYLLGLAELMLRTALRTELDRADTLTVRKRDAEGYMRAHLGDPALSADTIAAALFISRRRLYQLFDDGAGVSGRIRTMRIDKAKALLSDPTTARSGIGEIANDCGFASAAHFSRTFRKATGCTPKEFRARALGS